MSNGNKATSSESSKCPSPVSSKSHTTDPKKCEVLSRSSNLESSSSLSKLPGSQQSGPKKLIPHTDSEVKAASSEDPPSVRFPLVPAKKDMPEVCRWKDCNETMDPSTSLLEHIQVSRCVILSAIELTCIQFPSFADSFCSYFLCPSKLIVMKEVLNFIIFLNYLHKYNAIIRSDFITISWASYFNLEFMTGLFIRLLYIFHFRKISSTVIGLTVFELQFVN